MVPMMAVGQAAGVAAAIASARRLSPARIDITELQASLANQGAELRKGDPAPG
jgi:hypothetical protein